MGVMRFRSLSLSAILVLGCAEAPRPGAPPAPAAPALPKLEGVWASEGYGSQIEVTASGDLVRSQVTSVSCLPSWKAAVAARDPSEMTYRRGDRATTLHIYPTASPDRIRFRSGGAASDVFYRRVPRALAVCDRPTPDTPRSNFDVFAATFADNYPFFGCPRTLGRGRRRRHLRRHHGPDRPALEPHPQRGAVRGVLPRGLGGASPANLRR